MEALVLAAAAAAVWILPTRVRTAAHPTGVSLVFSPQQMCNPGEEALLDSTKQHVCFCGVFA